MRIIIATPLYPPEIGSAAVYAKELARRLAEHHEITIVAYARHPEQVPGVTVIEIDKQQSRLARIFTFRKALAQAAKNADAIIAINGASVEFPVLLGSTAPVVFCVADKAAHEHGGLLERLAFARARSVIMEVPDSKPEILPLEPEPTDAIAAWDAAWDAHVHSLEQILDHGD
ncbi:MAG TPA: hypothetical protein VF829_02355 [Candidatus Paceibacterota bacterium]